MTEHDQLSEDAAFEALRQADPTTPSNDISAMRSLVAAPRAGVVRLRRYRTAVVAAGIALVVGSTSGYQVAASQLGADVSQVEVSTAGDMSMVAGAPARTGGAAQSSVAQGAADKMMAYGGKPWLTPAADLSDEAGSEVGYLLSRDNVDMAARAAQLQEALGISGSVIEQPEGAFVIGDATGQAANAGTGGTSDQWASWWFNDPAASPWRCMVVFKGEVSDLVSPGSTPMPTVEPAPAPTCTPVSGDLVSKSKAISIAKRTFGQLGLAADDATWTASADSWFGQDVNGRDIPFRHVTAAVLVDGQASGMEWGMDIGPSGEIASANGFFATFVATAAYETVGAATATLRSQDALWSQLGPYEQGGGMIAYAQVRSGAAVAPSPSATLDAQGRPLLSAMLDRVIITKAVKSLSLYYLADGRTALLPAWNLTGDERTWTQIAVADKYFITGK